MPQFLIQTGDVVNFKTICQVPGQISVSSRQYQLVQSTSIGEVMSGLVLTRLTQATAPLFKATMAQTATYYGTMLYLDTPHADGWRPDTNGAERAVGTGGPSALPHQTCGLISLYSNTIGKKGQGRIYLPFPSTNFNGNDGNPTQLYLDMLAEFGAVLVMNQTVNDNGNIHLFAPVLYRKGGSPYQIGAFQARAGWATQRRRGNFGPTNELPF